MAADQTARIKIQAIADVKGFEDASSALKRLNQSAQLTDKELSQAREAIVRFAASSKNSQQVLENSVTSLRKLREQAELCGSVYSDFTADIQRFEGVIKGTTPEIDRQRQALLNSADASSKNVQTLERHANALAVLQRQTRIGSNAYQQFGRDIEAVRGRITGLSTEAQNFSRTLNQMAGATPEKLSGQIATLKQGMSSLRYDSEQYLQTLQRIQILSIAQSGRSGRAGVIAANQAYSSREYLAGFASPDRLPGMPDTTAALQQELSELRQRLENTIRTGGDYTDTFIRIAQVQKELSRELIGTTEAFKRLDIQMQASDRRSAKLAGIQEWIQYTSGLSASQAAGRRGETAVPGLAGYRDPETGAIIARGRRDPNRIPVNPEQYDRPIGPVEFPEAARRAQQQIEQSLDDVNRIYEDSRRRRAEIQAKYDQIYIDKVLEGLDLEGQIREKAFKDELADFDRRMEARDRMRRQKITAGQAVQAAGAALSGAIFGGPEGFLGSVGGAALGAAIPGLGIVGGSFAGAAVGAQLGMFRQQLGAAATYAAEIDKLRIALQGVVYSFEDYKAALQAIQSNSDQFNTPIKDATQQFTKLAAAVIGSGGSIKDAEAVYDGLTASVIATGGSIEDVGGALTAAQQVFSKGKVTAEELRGQIGERLAGAFALFAESQKKSTSELDASLQSGEVTLKQFVEFVQYSLKKYGETAKIIADSPSQAGARLDKALKNLQKNVGTALGPTGAAFQDFAARSVRGIDRIINKLVELKLVLPGADYYEAQVLANKISIPQLETRVLNAGAKETALRNQLGPLASLPGAEKLFPDFGQAIQEARSLEEALVRIRQTEKQTNKQRRDQQLADQRVEEEKLAQSLLTAIEQREEALADARIQREREISDIREDSIRRAKELEERFATDRLDAEREIQRMKREMAGTAADTERLTRLQQGADPEAIDLEQRLADISRKATEDKILAEQDFQYKEKEQKKAIADLQKQTAEAINKANEGYARRIGDIQKDYAKATARIVEEGSGKSAKRLEEAGRYLSLMLQRSAVNTQRALLGQSPIDPPKSYRDGEPIYAQPADSIPPQIRSIDKQFPQLYRKLSYQLSGYGIANQFLSLLGAQSGYQDVATTGKQVFPLAVERFPGAAQTTQIRRQQLNTSNQLSDQAADRDRLAVFRDITADSERVRLNLEDQNKQLQEQSRLISSGIKPELADQLATLNLTYAKELERLQAQKDYLIANGEYSASAETAFNNGVGAAMRLLDVNTKLTIEYEKQREAQQRNAQIIEGVLSPLGNSLASTMDLVNRGAENWNQSLREIASGVLNDIAQQLFRVLVIEQLISLARGALSSLFPGPKSAIPAALAQPAVAAKGMAFAKNGIRMFANGGVVNSPTLFRFAQGTGLMGEAGPEAIIPLKRGTDGKLGVSGGGGTSNVVVNVDAKGTSVQGDQGQGAALGRVIASAVQAELIKQKRPGGLLAK